MFLPVALKSLLPGPFTRTLEGSTRTVTVTYNEKITWVEGTSGAFLDQTSCSKHIQLEQAAQLSF